MARWWDNEMASASQALYSDPSMAFDVASLPDQAFAANVMQYTQEQQEIDTQKVQQERDGFFGTLAGWYSDVDKALMDIPGLNVGWTVSKAAGAALWYPVDKLASGAHWLYSEGISQPLSTYFLTAGKAVTGGGVGTLFDSEEWAESYDKAERISPGQAAANFGATVGTQLRETGELPFFQEQSEDSQRITERMLYDTEYWRDKAGWKYTAGSGAADFSMVLGLDPSTYIIGGVGQVVKGARSIQLVNKGGEVVRDRGLIADTARKYAGKKPETVTEVSRGQQMQDFFDWVAAPSAITGASRKSAAEIEAHPIWGRGRRINPVAPQYSQVLSTWAREDMELGFRFMAGDNSAVAPLMERGGKALGDVGRLSENRVALSSTRLDTELIGYYAAIEGRRPTVAPIGITSGTPLLAEAGRDLYKTKGVTDASAIDKAMIDEWKNAKLDLID
jgi:hypothetical protein